MSCLSVSFARCGEPSVETSLVPAGVSVSIGQIGELAAAFSQIGGIQATMTKESVTATLARVCDASVRTPYLDIDPTLLWIYPDIESSNDVISNTFWHVN